MPFNDDYPLWQYASCVIAPKKANQSKTLSSITVILTYDGNFNDKEFYSGTAFDNISLRQEPCNTYTYDSEGNLTAVNAAGSDSNFTYSAGNKLTKSQTKANGTYTFKYENSNNNHLVTKITNDNVSMNITYDKYGNSTGTTLSSDSNSSAGKIVTSAKYSDDGTQLLSQTDANGSTTEYAYNAQRTVRSQKDAMGTTNGHSYFSENDRPKTNYITNVISAGYEYSCGNLVTVRRSGFITSGGTKQTQYYNMGYDSFGNMTSISVGSRKLASYDYGSQNGNLRSMTYGNGATVSYTYDILGRVTEEKWGDKLKYQYVYSSDGYLAKKVDVTTGVAVNYEYDSLDRLIHSNQTDNGTVQQRTEHLYDSENRLISQSWQLGDTLYKESYAYSTADGSLTSVSNTGTMGYAFSYDALKRLASRYNWVYRQNYTYRTNGGNQTSQIASIDYAKRDGGTGFTEFKLGYAYDAAGNITKITGTTRTDQSASYTYDAQNQLTGETNQKGSYIYTYDTYGNIRSVSGAESHTYTYTYTYGDSEWLDLLTAYDGKAITYDTIGNPLSYYNGSRYTFTWQNGRQLASATVGGKTYNYQYDADGIRTRKTNYDGGYTEYYVVEGLPVAEQRFKSNGTKQYILRYLYDESNSPVGFGIYYPTASSPYWQYYYFGKNIQGDVIALYRSDYNSSSQSYYPTLVATYSYDPWGTPTGIYDANGNAISQTAYNVAAYNPFRYRGYRYDGDTRLYYLQSRYYDPAIGRFINADSPNFALTNPYSNGITDKNYFAYCDNNPISRSDDGGEIWNIVIGAVVGGIASGVSTLIECQKSGESLKSSLIQTAISATCGAIGGAVAGTGLGVAGQAITSGLLGGVESLGRQAVSDSKKISMKKVGDSIISGLVGGMIGGNGAAWGQTHYITQKRIAQNSIRKGASKWKTAVSFAKQTWRWSRRLTKDTIGGIVKSYTSTKVAGALMS